MEPKFEDRSENKLTGAEPGSDGQASAELSAGDGRMAFLAQASAALASSLDYTTTVRSLAQLAVPAIADGCMVDVLQPDGKVIRLAVTASDPIDAAHIEELRQFPPDLSMNEGVPRVFRSGQPLFLPVLDETLLPRIAQNERHLALIRLLSPVSFISVPLTARGKTFGALSLAYSKSGRRYGPGDLWLAQELGVRAAMAIDNARLYASALETGERYRSLVNGLDAIVWEGDPATFRFQYVSPQAEAILGYPVADWQTPGFWAAHLYPPDREQALALCLKASSEGRDHRLAYRMVAKDGRIVWLSDHVRVVKDPSGTNVQLRGVMVDISDQRSLEEAHLSLMVREETLRGEMAAARELSRLRNQFVHTVSHELRNPLTVMRGYLEMLEESPSTGMDERQQEYVEQMDHALARLDRLVDDLLDAARIQAGTFRLSCQDADLGGKARELVAAYRRSADSAGVQLTAALDEGPFMVRMDPMRIGQVLSNLLSNALKFTPRGGTVTVRIRRDGGGVRCEVADTGIGVAPEEIPRLFQPFSQLGAGQKEGHGLGLGLIISKAIIEAHGGTIGVESTPGQGSTFWFTLPRSDG